MVNTKTTLKKCMLKKVEQNNLVDIAYVEEYYTKNDSGREF